MKRILDIHTAEKYGEVETVRTHVLAWDSVDEAVAAVASAWEQNQLAIDDTVKLPPNPKNGYRSAKSVYGRDPKELPSWQSVREAMSKPWAEGMASFENLSADLAKVELPDPADIRRRPTWRESDGDFDYGRYAEGRECWRGAARRHQVGQQFVTLCVQIGGNADVTGERLAWRGVLAACLTGILEARGYSVEVLAYHRGEGSFKSGDGIMGAFWVKRSEQTLDVVSLVNATSPWFFRTVCFAEHCLVTGQTPTGGLGREVRADDRLIDLITPAADAWRINNVFGRDDAVEAAKSMLETLTANSQREPYDREAIHA